jgi:hypothetical protein
MKKTTATLILLICFSGLWAQYKKASFFDKEGRTYGIGITSHFFGDGRKAVPGFNLAFGRDQDGKQFFTFWEIRVLPSFKFSYETLDLDANPITVSGKSKLHLIFATNYGLFILKNDDAEQKFKPYVTAGMNFVILGGLKELDNEEYFDNAIKKAPRSQFSAGLGGGLGTILNLNSALSIKLEGGYTYQLNITSEFDAGEDLYYMLTPHPYASAGLRFRIVSE